MQLFKITYNPKFISQGRSCSCQLKLGLFVNALNNEIKDVND